VNGVVLTMGETMGLLDVGEPGTPRYGTTMTLRIAGAESNFAIGLTRLGVRVRWVSRLGQDLAGDVVWHALADEGVDLSFARRDQRRPTGLFFKWREGGATLRSYHRAGSAASALGPEDLAAGLLDDVSWVHLSGITLALSAEARNAATALARRARALDIPLTFDLNYRPQLWASAREAAAATAEVLPLATWVLCGIEEASALLGGSDVGEVAGALSSHGADRAVIRVGADGADVVDDGAIVHVPITVLETAVHDEVGAGDAFAAGFVLGCLRGDDPQDATRLAHRVAARALRGTGDWETLPTAAELGLAPS
jgi:2-dehydro-3-deoxygluconokinase